MQGFAMRQAERDASLVMLPDIISGVRSAGGTNDLTLIRFLSSDSHTISSDMGSIYAVIACWTGEAGFPWKARQESGNASEHLGHSHSMMFRGRRSWRKNARNTLLSHQQAAVDQIAHRAAHFNHSLSGDEALWHL